MSAFVYPCSEAISPSSRAVAASRFGSKDPFIQDQAKTSICIMTRLDLIRARAGSSSHGVCESDRAVFVRSPGNASTNRALVVISKRLKREDWLPALDAWPRAALPCSLRPPPRFDA